MNTSSYGAGGSNESHPHSNDSQARLLDQLNEVVFTTDSVGRLQYVNAAWSRITGIPTSDAIGHDVVDFVVEEERDLCLARHHQVLDGRRATAQHEAWFRTAENEKRWLAVHVLYGECRCSLRIRGGGSQQEAFERVLRDADRAEPGNGR